MPSYGEITKVRKGIMWRIFNFDNLAQNKPVLESSGFYFQNLPESWYLEIYKHEIGFWGIYLNRNDVDYEVECSFHLSKRDLSEVHLGTVILKRGDKSNGPNNFINMKELLDQSSELMPDSTVTIICAVQHVNGIVKRTPSKFSRLDALSANLKSIYADKDTCDVTLKVKDKEFRAHRLVLMARSSVFSATFRHETLERQTGIITIPDCEPDSFAEFLEYLYSGELEELSIPSAMNLYYISNKYDVGELKLYCMRRLMNCLTVQNVCEIATLADKIDDTELFCAVQDYFNMHFMHIFLESDWKFLLENDRNLADKLLTGMAKKHVKTEL